ncbi:polr2d [Symbiodinium sp. KB8]|nr:polr2d [Symbiodinium sp. KB8]
MAAVDTRFMEADQEDTEQGNFGPGMEGATFLSNAEVAIVLDAHVKHADGKEQSGTFTKAHSFCKKFGGIQGADAEAVVEALRPTLAGLVFDLHDAEGAHERRLSDFELVSLMNLRPTTVDMTRAVLPSLNDLSDDDIAGILGTLASTASSLMA